MTDPKEREPRKPDYDDVRVDNECDVDEVIARARWLERELELWKISWAGLKQGRLEDRAHADALLRQAHRALSNLYAMVNGEVPLLLEDDHHDAMVRDALAAVDAYLGESDE